MKRVVSILIIILCVCLPLQVKALSVSESNLTIDPGQNETIDLYASVEVEITKINFTLVYTSYDVPAYFNVDASLSDVTAGITHSISFAEPKTGQIKLGTIKVSVVNDPQVVAGTVNVHTATAVTVDGETINLNANTINVTVNEKEETSDTDTNDEDDVVTDTTTTTNNNVNNNTNNNTDNTNTNSDNNKKEETEDKEKQEETKTEESKGLLEKIESEIVKIELEEDVYEYTVRIKEDVLELDLKPIVKDEKYKVEISSQKISELTDNTITIKVSDGKINEEYKIKVKVVQKEEITIDKEEFEPTFQYKGKWVTLIITFGIILMISLFLNKKNK